MTNLLSWLFGVCRRVFERLGFCAMIGAIIGILAGFMIGLIQRVAPVFDLADIATLGVIFGILLWLFVLFLLVFLLRYRFASVGWAALVNALLTCTLTAIALNTLQTPPLGFLIGGLVGIVVGALFCRLCNITKRG